MSSTEETNERPALWGEITQVHSVYFYITYQTGLDVRVSCHTCLLRIQIVNNNNNTTRPSAVISRKRSNITLGCFRVISFDLETAAAFGRSPTVRIRQFSFCSMYKRSRLAWIWIEKNKNKRLSTSLHSLVAVLFRFLMISVFIITMGFRYCCGVIVCDANNTTLIINDTVTKPQNK